MSDYTNDFNIMLERLKKTRIKLNENKDDKLLLRWSRHGDYRKWNNKTIITHLESEIKELKEELNCNYPHAIPQAKRIKDEIIDVINCLEFLYDVLNLGFL